MKDAVKHLVTDDLRTFIQEGWDDIHRTSYHNVQSGIHSLLYIVAEQVMLDLGRKAVIGETLDA